MTSNPEFLSPCGLHCGVCAIRIAHQDGNEKFKQRLVGLYQGGVAGKGILPGSQGLTTADIHCSGCLSDDRFMHCQQCTIRECTQGKGYAGCWECAEFPCRHIEEFPMAVGKRVMMRAVPEIRQKGLAQWDQDEMARYHCPQCGKRLFRGVVKCNQCGEKVNLD